MSVLKRKKDASVQAKTPAKKRVKLEVEDKQSGSTTSAVKPALSSQLPIAFPRGGASASSIKDRQIPDPSRKRVVSEGEVGLFDDEQSVDGEEKAGGPDPRDTASKSKQKKRKTGDNKKSQSDERSRVESLSSKKLAEGSLLLGRIKQIHDGQIVVSLPNGLLGFVNAAHVSAKYRARLQAFVETEDDAVVGTNEDSTAPSLSDDFQIGQLLRCAYLEPEDQEHKKLLLSIDPAATNSKITRSSISQGLTLQASVVSMEDHGMIVDLDLPDSTKGFIARTNFPSDRDISTLSSGAVLLTVVTEAKPKGNVVQLSADLAIAQFARSAASVDAILPGTKVQVLLTEVSEEGLVGKVMGMLDVSADVLHSGAFIDKESFTDKYKIGQKVIGRILANLPQSDEKRLLFSVLPGLVTPVKYMSPSIKPSTICESAQTIDVVPGLGIFVKLGENGYGFAHISRLSDTRTDTLSATTGPYKMGSIHKVRVLQYDGLDNMYTISLQKSVLDKKYLSLEDVTIAEVIAGTIEKVLVGESGVRGLLVKLIDGIVGFVPAIHMSDVVLKNPEAKFRAGMQVKARVLDLDPVSRKLTLTLKKSLISMELPVWFSFHDIEAMASATGTIVKVESSGAVVKFFGPVRGYLPVAEMSQAYIKDAREHFKVGQTLTVFAKDVDAGAEVLTLTVNDISKDPPKQEDLPAPGSFVSGTVVEKSANDLTVSLTPNGHNARLTLDHVCDGSEKKRLSALNKIRVGQKLENLLVLDRAHKSRLIILCNRESLKEAAEQGKILTKYEDLRPDAIFTGFVNSIMPNMVFVNFAGGISGLMNSQAIPDAQVDSPDFGLKRLQAITVRVLNIDYRGATPKFKLTMKPRTSSDTAADVPPTDALLDPIDPKLHSREDLTVGRQIKVRITSVKDTQLNVEIAKGIQGRIDASEIFDSIDDIKDRKRPLLQFSNEKVLDAKILGVHDSRSYRFLPISHRGSKNVVYELSAKPSTVSNNDYKPPTLATLRPGDECLCFVNNVGDHGLFVNVSPGVRGRIQAKDVSDDLNLVASMSVNFPVGSVLKAKVVKSMPEKNQLDLSARSANAVDALTLKRISAGDIVAGRITKITDRGLIVQLGPELIGIVELIDLADDFDQSDPAKYSKNTIVRAFVVQVDVPNKKVWLSLRASKTISSGVSVKDAEISSVNDVNKGDLVRGFVRKVDDIGVFVTVGHNVSALVRVTDLSDEFLTQWKDHFEVGQLVKGRVTLVDTDSGAIQMSLKRSKVDDSYKALTTIRDLSVGDFVDAHIAKIERFGVFIVVDHSENVRGLCHRSEIAEQRIEDVTTLSFQVGDRVKAKVLKIDVKERRINFGMKASYFSDDIDSASEGDIEMADIVDETASPVIAEPLLTVITESADDDGASDSEQSDSDIDVDLEANSSVTTAAKGLNTSGFDWSGTAQNTAAAAAATESDPESDDQDVVSTKKKTKLKSKTKSVPDAVFDPANPQTPDDFDRLLLSDPANPSLWLRYIAHYLDSGSVDRARSTADRAIASTPPSHVSSKLSLWTALLNLEVSYGDNSTVQATLDRASAVLDPEEIYTRLASILIQAGKHTEARAHFDTTIKRFTQSPGLYLNYATFLFDQASDPAAARALLPRALQALPAHAHLDTTMKFAQLEFKTGSGVPEEGRTRFQGLFNLYPRRLDLFNVQLDLEMSLLPKVGGDEKEGQKEQVRGLFEQVLQSGRLKPAKAKPFLERWLKFEEKWGDDSSVDEVKARAARWVDDYARRQREEK